MPAPAFTNLTGSGGSGATSFATASISPTGNRLILVTVHAYISTGSAQPAQPTVTGNGITYALVRAQDVDAAGTDRATMWVFRGMAASPSAGAITIDFGAVTMTRCQWSVDQSDANVDTTGTNGSGAIVQTTGVTTASGATSGSVNYPVAMAAGNSGFSAWGHQVQEAKTPRASWTELADVTTVTLASVETQYIAGTDTAGSASWATGSRAGGIIVEVKAAGGQSVAVGQALETDAAQAIGRRKVKALGAALETDTAVPITIPGGVAIGPALETEFSMPVGKRKQQTATFVTETDTALSFGRVKRRALGVALEVDTALFIGEAEPIFPAFETDQARPLGRRKVRAVGPAIETNTALEITRFIVTKIVKFPTYKERLGEPRLFSRYTKPEPVSLIKKAGAWSEIVSPHQDEISAAQKFYQGGHRHVLTEAEAADLPPQYVEEVTP